MKFLASSCSELNPNQPSGLYNIPINGKNTEVFCDMKNYGGGWTIIQRRGDYGNDENYFNRNWTEYKNGFGHPKKEFWIGLEAIHKLTNSDPMDVRHYFS